MIEEIENILSWLDYTLNGDIRSASIDRWRDDAKRNPYQAYMNLRDTPVRYHAEALGCLDDDVRSQVAAYMQSDSAS